MIFARTCRAAAIAISCAASTAFAAAPDALMTEQISAGTGIAAPDIGYLPDTEIVVRDWVLCISLAVAERLVHAGEESAEQAAAAYADLSKARSCGKFAEMRVILQERLYVSAAEGSDAGIYGALVNIAGDWATGFVIYGGLPAE